jgi:uncharacterized protein (TIGR03086 family)
VVNHTTWVVQMFGAAVQGQAPPHPRDADVLGSDPAGSFAGAAAATLAAWKTGGTDGSIRIPVGELPATVGLGINTVDVFVHGWDIARATGQDARLDPALCTELLDFTVQLLPPDGRGNGFGPVVEIDSDASVVDRFIAYTGRKP